MLKSARFNSPTLVSSTWSPATPVLLMFIINLMTCLSSVFSSFWQVWYILVELRKHNKLIVLHKNQFIDESKTFYFSVDDVYSTLVSVNPRKGCGPDSIPPDIFGTAPHSLASPECTLFNNSVTTGVFPEIWKLRPILELCLKHEEHV